MTIFEVIRNDHNLVKKILGEMLSIKDTDQDKQTELLEKLTMELTLHNRAEEQIFYKFLQENAETRDLIEHSKEEHEEVEELFESIKNYNPGDKNWMKQLLEIQKNLLHHIETEETESFDKAKEIMKAGQHHTLADEFQKAKKEWSAKL
ncbi:hemerythrin domain-containing protein [Candidatus Odyssella thessalonicensis]|uniref:hemerythrin domain-containing protein n=1 Tax=Candidatus Odyssella thessalonicensis TaxID=84647 RepID=UPI000225B73A|nr:hemerythrin domain-containing protein [Candidatus Odyssella thessalonicensis]